MVEEVNPTPASNVSLAIYSRIIVVLTRQIEHALLGKILIFSHGHKVDEIVRHQGGHLAIRSYVFVH